MSKSEVSRKRRSASQRRKRQQAGVWIAVALGGVVLLAALFLSSGSQVGALDFEATTLSGEAVRLSDYRGQVVMLNFWATWCPPCRREMPDIQAAYAQHAAAGFAVLAINNAETAPAIQPFASSLGLEFPIVLDTAGSLQRAFGIRGYPTSIFIDRSGAIYATHSGMVTSEQIAGYIADGFAMATG